MINQQYPTVVGICGKKSGITWGSMRSSTKRKSAIDCGPRRVSGDLISANCYANDAAEYFGENFAHRLRWAHAVNSLRVLRQALCSNAHFVEADVSAGTLMEEKQDPASESPRMQPLQRPQWLRLPRFPSSWRTTRLNVLRICLSSSLWRQCWSTMRRQSCQPCFPFGLWDHASEPM